MAARSRRGAPGTSPDVAEAAQVSTGDVQCSTECANLDGYSVDTAVRWNTVSGREDVRRCAWWRGWWHRGWWPTVYTLLRGGHLQRSEDVEARKVGRIY